jgi:hypothetical protein
LHHLVVGVSLNEVEENAEHAVKVCANVFECNDGVVERGGFFLRGDSIDFAVGGADAVVNSFHPLAVVELREWGRLMFCFKRLEEGILSVCHKSSQN